MLRVNLDCGNFPGEPYSGITKLAPLAKVVHAKTYPGGGVWYSLDIDYHRVASILAGADYHGYLSLEMEGNEPAATAVSTMSCEAGWGLAEAAVEKIKSKAAATNETSLLTTFESAVILFLLFC